MKNLNEYWNENVKMFDFNKILKTKSRVKFSLNEADDDDGDDAGGADAGADAGGDDLGDDLGGDLGGGDDMGGFGDDAGGSGGGDSGDDGEADGDGETEEKDTHEPDPDFTDGIKGETPVLDAEPAGETIYDSEGVMKSIKAVIETLPKEQLVEIEKVKNALELIFSGKKLNPEDLDFDNIQNAIFLISKIAEPLDDRTKNYMTIKLKQPLMKARDEDKLELANKAKELDKKRDTILNIDKIK